MYPEVKIYHDGSHFVGNKHVETIAKPKRHIAEEEAVIYDENADKSDDNQSPDFDDEMTENEVKETVSESIDTDTVEKREKVKPTGETKSQIFNRLFDESKDMKKGPRKAFLIAGMRKYFKTAKGTKEYVEERLERKRKNLINRRIRFTRKANLNVFNYFVTFTRNDALIADEKVFKKKLSQCLQHYHSKRGWTYMGSWEKSPNGRLHFHAIMNIPEGTMPGELELIKDFDKHAFRMQHRYLNTFFTNRFGRTDFSALPDNKIAKSQAVRYLMKYMEKSGEKMVYSRGIPMYIISDVEEQDVVGTMQTEYGEKLILHDKFNCWDEGCYVGEMSEETIKQLRTANQ